MLEITTEERAYLSEMRSLANDAQGREILVGLTMEESVTYLCYIKSRMSGQDNSPTAASTHLQLSEKHEKARLAVIGAEAYVRNFEPTRH